MMTTNRPNLSEEIASQVRELVVLGKLEPGCRINEVELARNLGVSRTPLRESLNFLVASGYLTVQPRKGFFVKPLSVDDVNQLYPIRAILDPEALKFAGLPSEAQLTKLRRVNDRIARCKGPPLKVIDLDDEWHRLLLSHCPNKILLELIDQLIWKTRRYEFLYMSESQNVEIAIDEHGKILDALEQRKLAKACQSLRQNMSTSHTPIVDWLNRRD